MDDIDRSAFAEQCVITGKDFGVNPHYLLAIAQLLTGIKRGDDGTGKFGPYLVTKVEWDAVPAEPDLEGFKPAANRQDRPMAQIGYAGLKTYQAQKQLLAGQKEDKGDFPSALQVFDIWPNIAAKRNDLQQALNDTASLVDAAIAAALGTSQPISVGGDSPIAGALAIGKANGVDGLQHDDYQKFCNVLGNMESGNKYNTKNSIGFVGRWQFGAGALQDSGNVHSGVNRNSGLNSPSAWTGKDGVSSLSDWLTGPTAKAAQDNAMQIYTQKHFQQLTPNSIQPGATTAHIAGMLAAAHLMGVGNARKLLQGQITHDANNTTTLKYYGILSKAFGGPARPPGV